MTCKTPTEGSKLAGSQLPFSIAGTGTPGSHILVTIGCTLPAPACTMPEELGQPWMTPIVVDEDGRWSVDASGATEKSSTGALLETAPSATRTIAIGPAH